MEVVIDPSTEEDTLETGNKRKRNAPRKFTESIHVSFMFYNNN